MDTKRHKRVVTYTLDADLVDQFRAWVAAQEPRPPLNAVVELALKRFLAEENEESKSRST